jgi:hypothetical protein
MNHIQLHQSTILKAYPLFGFWLSLCLTDHIQYYSIEDVCILYCLASTNQKIQVTFYLSAVPAQHVLKVSSVIQRQEF